MLHECIFEFYQTVDIFD